MDDALGPALSQCHVGGREHEFRTQMTLHRPTDDPARPHIEHHRQVQKAAPGGDVGDVRDPQSIRSRSFKAPVHSIKGHRTVDIGDGRAHKTLHLHASQACKTHQSCNPLASNANGVNVGQLGMDHRRAIRLARTAMDRMDLGRQRDIGTLSIRHRTSQPGIEATLGDLEHAAPDPYREAGLVRFHESEERFGFAELSLANQAAAFERISRSSLSWRFSRRNRLSSARSSVVSPPSPRPASRASCLTHSAMDQGVGPNSLDSSRGLRPARTSSTIFRRNSGAYRFCLLAIAD